MDAKEIIREFKRIDNWQHKKKSALFMTKKGLAECAIIEQEANQKKLNILNDSHQAKSKEEAEEMYSEAIKNDFLENIGMNHSLKLATEVNTALKTASGKEER